MMIMMNKLILKTVFVAVIFISLVGCEATVPSRTFPGLTFQHLQPINLKVSSVESILTYKSPMNAPNVDHLFPVSPGKALARWADDRLVAVGGKARGRFTIVDASVRETALEMKKGIKGAFTKDQSERYDAALEATLEIVDDNGTSRGFASAKVSRSISVREDATVNDREQAWFSLTEALMKDFNVEIEKNIAQYLADWQ